MMTLICGGSKCGKSAFAEKILDEFNGRKIYIATMEPYGQEAFDAIERHRRIRSGKNFETVEKYRNIAEIQLSKDCAILLECLGNLLANEMFSEYAPKNIADTIVDGLINLKKNSAELVVVSSTVDCDGIEYSPETTEYCRILAEINSCAAEFADNVVECVYGVPIALKGRLLC